MSQGRVQSKRFQSLRWFLWLRPQQVQPPANRAAALELATWDLLIVIALAERDGAKSDDDLAWDEGEPESFGQLRHRAVAMAMPAKELA